MHGPLVISHKPMKTTKYLLTVLFGGRFHDETPAEFAARVRRQALASIVFAIATVAAVWALIAMALAAL